MNVVTACQGVPAEVLVPRQAWPDKSRYDATARKLAGLFVENFKNYQASDEVARRGPEGRISVSPRFSQAVDSSRTIR